MGYAAQDGYGRLELRTWRLDQRREQRQAVLSTPPPDATLGSFAPVEWTTPDGLRLHGYVVYPPNFDPHRRYPLLVDLHGGGPGQALGVSRLIRGAGEHAFGLARLGGAGLRRLRAGLPLRR